MFAVNLLFASHYSGLLEIGWLSKQPKVLFILIELISKAEDI